MISSAAVEVATKNDPAASREHGVFTGYNLTEDASGERAEDTTQLEDGGQPTSGTGRGDNVGEVVLEAVHDQGLAENTLLIAIFEATESFR